MFKYDGIGQVVITAFTEDGNAGKVMSLLDSGMMLPGEAGAEFHGYCVHVKNNAAAVAVAGMVTVPYTGEVPTLGFCQLVSDGNGGVKVGTSAKSRLVLLVDTENKKITFMM